MPKKFNTDNTKAVVARERKKQAKEQAASKKQRELEEAMWKDDNKQLQKKQQKKEAEERKRHEALERKAQAKALLEQEMAETSKKCTKAAPPAKVTRAQISKAVAEAKPKEKERRIETHLDAPLIENINRLQFDGENARTIEQAIAVLGNDPDFEMHPEKRVRAAFKVYQTRRIKELKAEKAPMRLTQMKQLIFKQWQNDPENPMVSGDWH